MEEAKGKKKKESGETGHSSDSFDFIGLKPVTRLILLVRCMDDFLKESDYRPVTGPTGQSSLVFYFMMNTIEH